MDAKIARMEEAEGAALAAKPPRAEQAYQAYRAGERNAEVIAADYQSRKAIQDFRAGERASYEPAAQPKSWWQRAGEWVQDKVDKFVMHPPSWLSVSWSSPEFSLNNYTVAHISYQPLARNFLETITYQSAQATVKTKGTLTTNPRGWLDIDFSDGTITFQGKERSVFVQPFALSFGWKSALNPRVVNDNTLVQSVNTTSVDFDLLGTNWCSLKISHGEGIERKTTFEIGGTEVEKANETSLDVTMQVHRWPRLVAIAGAVYVIFQVGVLEAVTTAGPVLLEQLSNSVQQIPVLLERLSNSVQQIPALVDQLSILVRQGVSP